MSKAKQPTPLERMTTLDEELEQRHPGWMTGEQPTITQADIELWRAGNAAALDAAGFVMDAVLCRKGQFDNLPTAKAFQQEIAKHRTTSLAAQDGLVEALEHIVEYWNRDQNEDAMSDALWHIIETASDALSAIKEQHHD